MYMNVPTFVYGLTLLLFHVAFSSRERGDAPADTALLFWA